MKETMKASIKFKGNPVAPSVAHTKSVQIGKSAMTGVSNLPRKILSGRTGTVTHNHPVYKK